MNTLSIVAPQITIGNAQIDLGSLVCGVALRGYGHCQNGPAKMGAVHLEPFLENGELKFYVTTRCGMHVNRTDGDRERIVISALPNALTPSNVAFPQP